jgi:hypothetical protein
MASNANNIGNHPSWIVITRLVLDSHFVDAHNFPDEHKTAASHRNGGPYGC